MGAVVERLRVIDNDRGPAYAAERIAGVVAIVDESIPQVPRRSVTNGAEDVISFLQQRGFVRPGDRVVYRNTSGRWDEMRIDDECRFVGFEPIGAASLAEAIASIGRENGADAN